MTAASYTLKKTANSRLMLEVGNFMMFHQLIETNSRKLYDVPMIQTVGTKLVTMISKILLFRIFHFDQK